MAANPVTNIPAQITFIITDKELVCGIQSSAVYPLNGISAADSRFYFKILDFDSNVVYQNPAFDATPDYTDPDIAGSAGSTWLNDLIDAPLNGDDTVVKGIYTVSIIQRDQTQVVTDTFTQSFTVDFQYTAVQISVVKTIQLFNPPLISITDVTNYSIKDAQDGALLLPTTQTRDWDLFFPSALQFAPITSTGSSIQTTKVYPGTYSLTLSTPILYTLDSSSSICDLIIIDTLTYSDPRIWIPDTNLNRLYCCLKTAENRFYDAWRNNTDTGILADLREKFELATSYYSLTDAAIQYGSYDDVVNSIARLKEVTNCDEDCECNDEDDIPEQLTGWGTQNITDKIEEIAAGLNDQFPTATADQNKLKNLSFTDNDFAVFDNGILIPGIGTGSTLSFSTTTGICTFNYEPSVGSVITILIYKS